MELEVEAPESVVRKVREWVVSSLALSSVAIIRERYDRLFRLRCLDEPQELKAEG